MKYFYKSSIINEARINNSYLYITLFLKDYPTCAITKIYFFIRMWSLRAPLLFVKPILLGILIIRYVLKEKLNKGKLSTIIGFQDKTELEKRMEDPKNVEIIQHWTF